MGCQILEKRLIAGFRWYGELVGRRPLPFLAVPVLITLIIGPGLLTMKFNNDVLMLFTPYSAPSRREQVIAREFAHTAIADQNSSGDGAHGRLLPMSSDKPYTDIWFNLQVSSEENVMTQPVWTLIADFVRTIYENFTCEVDDWIDDSMKSGKRGPYVLQYRRDFCNPNSGCIQIDSMVNRVRDLMNATKFASNPKVRLTYPIMSAWDQSFNWGQYIFGVRVDPDTRKLLSAKIIALYFQYQVNTADSRVQLAAEKCIRQMTKYIFDFNADLNKNRAVPIKFLPLNEIFISDEVARMRDYFTPTITAVILFIFAFIAATSFKRRFACASILGASMGLLTVGIALLVSTALLCLCGVRMTFVTMVVPFLVLCVGIDNDFLITSAWRKTADGRSSIAQRLGRAFADCGPSLTITSINDILCFGIGYISETPAVADFCLHTCVSLAFRFIFQLSFFAAVTAYIGMWEAYIERRSNGTRSAPILTLPAIDSRHTPKKSMLSIAIDFTSLQRTNVVTKVRQEHQRIHDFFGKHYANFLTRKDVRVLTAASYFIYVVLAVWGGSQWKIDISSRKLFFDDSLVQVVSSNGDRYVFPEATIGRVYVNSPPDFRYKSNLTRFFQFVRDLENINFQNSPRDSSNTTNATDLWLYQYADFLQFSSDSENLEFQPDFYDYMSDFLHSAEMKRFFNDLRFKVDPTDQSIKLDKCQFTVSYFRDSSHPFTFHDHVQTMLRWREICKNYSDFEAIVFDNFNMNAYYDQSLTLAATCLQTMGIALLSMSAVTALLMPDIRSMFFICLSFLSVDLGVVAALNVWHTDLDPISLAFVLMTVGFSVYYTARVCYCYQVADRRLISREKMRRTMETVGWPILQGAIATFLGVLPPVLIHSYMLRVFYRTVMLVVFIGLAHGLLFMPAIMSAFDRTPSSIQELREYAKKRQYRRGTDTSHGGQSADTLSEYSDS